MRAAAAPRVVVEAASSPMVEVERIPFVAVPSSVTERTLPADASSLRAVGGASMVCWFAARVMA